MELQLQYVFISPMLTSIYCSCVQRLMPQVSFCHKMACSFERWSTAAGVLPPLAAHQSLIVVQGALRIAHCGGYHGDIDLLIDAVNLVAKLLGHPIHWDSETIGCNPSLSSIPVAEQRTFTSALAEIGDWLDLPENEHEFLVLYLDDQADLLDWVRLWPSSFSLTFLLLTTTTWQILLFGTYVNSFLVLHANGMHKPKGGFFEASFS